MKKLEIPEIVVCGLCLWDLGIWFRFTGVDCVWLGPSAARLKDCTYSDLRT